MPNITIDLCTEKVDKLLKANITLKHIPKAQDKNCERL